MNRKIAIVGIPIAGWLLVSCIAFALMERHWSHVTRRLTEGMARDMAAIVDLYEASTGKEDIARLIHTSLSRLGLAVAVLPPGALPPPGPKPYFDFLDRALADEIRTTIKRPFWIDTVGHPHHVEVRIVLDQAILRFLAPRRQVYASNAHIFLIWMLGISAIVLAVGCLALRPGLRAT